MREKPQPHSCPACLLAIHLFVHLPTALSLSLSLSLSKRLQLPSSSSREHSIPQLKIIENQKRKETTVWLLDAFTSLLLTLQRLRSIFANLFNCLT